ncbi:MAG: signal peptidase II [Bacilli bacterium]|jgi:signal peptidase II|nr:signal peptidase II [Erysipelotrichia bacterium]
MKKIKKYFTSKTIKEIALDFFYSFIWVMILVFLFDIISKWLIVKNLTLHQEVQVIPNFFYLHLTFNQGAAFGLGNTGDLTWRVLFIVISVVMVVGMSGYYFKNGAKMKLFMRLALALMIGGAFGNLIDRAFYWHSIVGFSGVIDFLSFEFWGWRFATFNIADSALVVGTILLIVSLLIEDFKKEKIVKEDLSKAPQEYLDELEQKQKENE